MDDSGNGATVCPHVFRILVFVQTQKAKIAKIRATIHLSLY